MGKYKLVDAQFIRDKRGKRRFVVLSWKDFRQMCKLVEDQLDAITFDKAVAKSSGKFKELEELEAKLKRDGRL